jgi:hypothetical protein
MDFKRIELRQDDKSKQWLPYIDGVMMDGVIKVEVINERVGNRIYITLDSSMVSWPQVRVYGHSS